MRPLAPFVLRLPLLLLAACGLLRGSGDGLSSETAGTGGGLSALGGHGLATRGWRLLQPPRQIDTLLGHPPHHVVGRPTGVPRSCAGARA